jgi:hypothetical protein
VLTYTGRSGSFTGNGRKDLLTRNVRTGELFVHPHSGRLDGVNTYADPVLVGTGFAADFHLWVGAADFTGNGLADMFTLTIEEQGYIYLNKDGMNGLETFAEPVHVGGKRPDIVYDTIAIADLNGAGKTDIIGRQVGGRLIDVVPFNGSVDGTNSFGDPYRFAVIGEDDIPVGAADVTGDGKVDLLVLHPDGDLSVLEPTGDETDDGGTWHRIGTGWDRATIISVSDVTGDGRPDLLALHDDGTLHAHVHSGKFDPAEPAAVFAEPVVVATGWTEYNAIS